MPWTAMYAPPPDHIDENWDKDASCKGIIPTKAFYIDQYTPTTQEVIELQQVCLECPVRTECLWTAINNKEKYGIWGGATPAHRDAIRRKNSRGRRNVA